MSIFAGERGLTDLLHASEAVFIERYKKLNSGPAQAPIIAGVKETVTPRINQDHSRPFKKID
jgi:hypothetical protein